MTTLGEALSANQQRIVDEWVQRVRALPSARELPDALLRGHIPVLLEDLVRALASGTTGEEVRWSVVQEHARARHRQGYDLRQVISEFQSLRRLLVEQLCDTDPRPSIPSILTMHDLLDRAVIESVVHFSRETERMRETFVGVLGHDLRAPLSAIALHARWLSGRDPDDCGAGVARTATSILSSAARMERMIAELLDFARGRLAGGIQLHRRALDLRTLLRATVAELELAHPDREIACMRSGEAGDLRGEWDADRIAQAISNLVANALEHGRDPVVVEALDEGPAVAIEVHNRGSIDEAVRPHLFEPFKRARRGTARRGLGLGLYIVREIAKSHGGIVEVESPEGETTFRLVLPRAPVQLPSD